MLWQEQALKVRWTQDVKTVGPLFRFLIHVPWLAECCFIYARADGLEMLYGLEEFILDEDSPRYLYNVSNRSPFRRQRPFYSGSALFAMVSERSGCSAT